MASVYIHTYHFIFNSFYDVCVCVCVCVQIYQQYLEQQQKLMQQAILERQAIEVCMYVYNRSCVCVCVCVCV